ncbi:MULTISPECIES: metal ABC transporter permease [unclassified Psychrobacter]|uniref:metal ABC transporter permease n=1 Tax=unclassified Psychrobacter TaxID=196806 RepID=UPI00071E83AE|nr:MULTISPECIES: metal ABC transporter permease [unclassified Psychrobacter]OLF36723.1 DNA repair protein [Psychrobacter sp. Cmf 22.2]
MTAWLAIIAPAWIAGSILGLLSAPLGCLVLWRRMAFFADALSHGTLLGVAIAVWWQLPMGIGIAIVSVLVVLALLLIEDERLPTDAVLAVVAVSLLCLGLLTLTQLTDQQANVLGFLFGNLLELDWADLPLLAGSVLVGLVFLAYIWPAQIKLATHEALARIQRVNPTRQRLFFMGVLAGFCAIALQAVGSLLISGLLVLPALTARLWSTAPKQMVVFSLIIAQVGVTLGIWGSIWLDIQTGLAIVLVLAVLFFSALLITKTVTKIRV